MFQEWLPLTAALEMSVSSLTILFSNTIYGLHMVRDFSHCVISQNAVPSKMGATFL